MDRYVTARASWYKAKPVIDDWDAVASDWVRANPQALWRAHSDAVNSALLERWLPHGLGAILKTDLFDEAFGDGLAVVLARHARNVFGIDLSSTVVAAARNNNPTVTAVRADVRSLPFDDATFDAIVSISTLDHFRAHADIAISLAEACRTLKRGGVLVLTLDNRANPLVALRNALPYRALHAVGLVPYFVGATYGPAGLQRALEAAGFLVQSKTAVLHCPRVVAVPLSTILQRRASNGVRRSFCRMLARFERLAELPTRYVTGHYVAVRAVKL